MRVRAEVVGTDQWAEVDITVGTTGDVVEVAAGHYPEGFTVPAGQTWRIRGHVTTPRNVIVLGTLIMRAGDRLTFQGVAAGYVGGGIDVLASDVGLWTMGAGRLDIQGTQRTGWARDTRPADWLPDDEVVIAPSAPFGTADWAKWELTTAGAVVMPQGGITLDGSRLPTEVANLTRDCVIDGVGHVFIRSSSPQTIRWAALNGLGIAPPLLGRYPLHFHMAHDGSDGSIVEGVVVRGGKHHAFVPHGSNGITFIGCVAYDTRDEAFWWDPGADHAADRIRWIDSVAFKTTPSDTSRFGAFVLGSGLGNECLGCVAVGVPGTKSQGGGLWPENPGGGTGADPNSGVWRFERFVAHNCGNGIHVWQNDKSLHDVGDDSVLGLTAYHCQQAAVNHGAYFNAYRYAIESYGNAFGVFEHALSKAPPQPRALEYRAPILDGRGRAGAVGFHMTTHNAPGADVVLTSPVFRGNATDVSLALVINPTQGPHALTITNPTWSAPPGRRVVWAPGTYIPGCHVNVDGRVLTPGTNL